MFLKTDGAGNLSFSSDLPTTSFTGATVETSIADADLVLIYDDSATASDGGMSGEVQILGDTQSASINKQYLSLCNGSASGSWSQSHLAVGYLERTEALTGVTFFFSSGNIASGVFKLYGIK